MDSLAGHKNDGTAFIYVQQITVCQTAKKLFQDDVKKIHLAKTKYFIQRQVGKNGMTTLNSKQLRMTNQVAERQLQKNLSYITSELHRHLITLYKDKLDMRDFLRKVRRCDSNYHPDSLK